jgi:HD-GYP domain-containing protein (c-di-GMP phosphodiesterase class II)
MLQAVIKALPVLVLEIDQDGIILDFNSDTPSLFEMEYESYRHKHISEFFPTQVASEIQTVVSIIKNGEPPPTVSFSTNVGNDIHWYEARFISSNRKHNIVVVQDITKYKISETKIQKQLDQISALRAIDQVIISSVDLNLTLSILLKELVKQLHIDAACILLWSDDTKRFEYGAGLGFKTSSLTHTKLRFGEGYAGAAALEQRIIQIDLSKAKTSFEGSPTLGNEQFVSYIGVPLVAKGQVQGVLEIFNRSTLSPDPDWLAFLEMLGGQAAIAIDNAFLLRDLQHTNTELISAYNKTIEGWSRALELRDHETKGHTQRVTKMTVELAGKLEITGLDLLHIQRGATLHDIGKMGIPDYILHKPGPLSEEEWDIMRQHPQLAFDLLSKIDYLRPATDIPCYHHERWNGSGYPLGLQGDSIPLAARLFSIVDVYDALISDRPYRPAWSDREALTYIQDQAGELFDPEIVPVFLELIEENYTLNERRYTN